MGFCSTTSDPAERWISAFFIPPFQMSFLCPSTSPFFLKPFITHIILLPSTRMRHQFFCQWELQMSSELALEEMGGDSGRRWGDRLTNMFELALTPSRRESTLGNQRDFRGQIAAFQSHEWRFVSEQHAGPVPSQSGWVLQRKLQPGRHLHACHPASSFSKVSWAEKKKSNKPHRRDVKVPMLMNSQMLILIAQ